jgi:hypothetical protein
VFSLVDVWSHFQFYGVTWLSGILVGYVEVGIDKDSARISGLAAVILHSRLPLLRLWT